MGWGWGEGGVGEAGGGWVALLYPARWLPITGKACFSCYGKSLLPVTGKACYLSQVKLLTCYRKSLLIVTGKACYLLRSELVTCYGKSLLRLVPDIARTREQAPQ